MLCCRHWKRKGWICGKTWSSSGWKNSLTLRKVSMVLTTTCIWGSLSSCSSRLRPRWTMSSRLPREGPSIRQPKAMTAACRCFQSSEWIVSL